MLRCESCVAQMAFVFIQTNLLERCPRGIDGLQAGDRLVIIEPIRAPEGVWLRRTFIVAPSSPVNREEVEPIPG